MQFSVLGYLTQVSVQFEPENTSTCTSLPGDVSQLLRLGPLGMENIKFQQQQQDDRTQKLESNGVGGDGLMNVAVRVASQSKRNLNL